MNKQKLLPQFIFMNVTNVQMEQFQDAKSLFPLINKTFN